MRVRALHIIVVLLVCGAVYWPMLGAAGFGSSEGHRVGPAWDMLETGDWTHLRLFGLTYLRKPPGMPWAIALSTSLFGHTEFAARAVSALASTIMALIALWFTNRWLGSPWGLAAGLAQALLPLFSMIGRTAEIDPLNALATQVAAFSFLSMIARPPRISLVPSAECLLPISPLLFPIGIILAGIVKGPASLPVLVGIALAACIQAKSLSPLRNRALWTGLIIAAAVLGAFAWWFAGENRVPNAVTQDFSEFTWSLSRLAGTAMLLPNSFLAAIPASIAIIVLLVQRRDPPERRDVATLPFASLLAFSWACSVLFLMLSGSSNPRYAMPAGALLAPLAAWAIRACWLARHTSALARIAILGHPMAPALFLLIASVAWFQYDVRRPRHQEGRHAGAAIAGHLPHDAEVWANDLVEARPDVLLYAESWARRDSRTIHPRWKKPQLLGGEVPPQTPGRDSFLLLREDDESTEVSRYRDHLASGTLRRVASGRIAKYEWTLLQVAPVSASEP
jgi:4-amino-4-deoxy-L-arabinose transferase-like glycosyltransferase